MENFYYWQFKEIKEKLQKKKLHIFMFEKSWVEDVWLDKHNLEIKFLMGYEGKENISVQTRYNVCDPKWYVILDEVSWEEVVDFVPDANTIPAFQKKSLGYDVEEKKIVDIVVEWDQGKVTVSVNNSLKYSDRD